VGLSPPITGTPTTVYSNRLATRGHRDLERRTRKMRQGEYLMPRPHVVIRLAIQESLRFLPRPALALVSSVTIMGPSMARSAIIAPSIRRTSITPAGPILSAGPHCSTRC
jgi:hypothetical protein